MQVSCEHLSISNWRRVFLHAWQRFIRVIIYYYHIQSPILWEAAADHKNRTHPINKAS
jgi:hypothetical protein